MDQTAIVPTYGDGPVIVQGGSTVQPLPIVASLLSGSGGALSFADPTLSGNGFTLDLRSASDMDLNGLAQFTAEFTFEITNNTGSTVTFLGSRDYSGNHTALEMLLYEQSNKLETTITIGGQVHTLDATVTVDSSPHHYAVTYDGSTVRMFYDGNLVASQAASGTLTQAPQEDMTLGLESRGVVVDGLWRTNQGGFVMDGIRFSDTARYTSNFSRPTAKVSNDSHTLLLLNFDKNPDFYTVAQSKGGTVWLPRLDVFGGIGNVDHVLVSDMTTYGGIGYLVTQCTHCMDDRVSSIWSRIGIQYFNNSYRSETTDLQVTQGANGWLGFAQSVDSNPVNVTNAYIDAGKIGYYSSGGGDIESIYISVSPNTDYALWVQQGSSENNFSFNTAFVDYEPVGGSPLIADLHLESPLKATFTASVFENYNNTPTVEVNGGSDMTFVGCEFNSDGQASAGGPTAYPPELIDILSPPTDPLLLTNPQIVSPSSVPLTNDPSSVTVQ